MNVTIFDHNPNGYNSKRASIEDLLDIVRPTVATFHLTAAVEHNQIKLKNYHCFQKNGKRVKQISGFPTFVINEVEANTLKVKEGEEDEEYMSICHDHVNPQITMINFDGGQESRTSRLQILSNWTQLRKEIKEIEDRDEGV